MVDKNNINFQLIPPDGGWGYAIAISTTLVYIATIVPLGVFGIIFGEFLSTVGDETSGATLATTTFNTVSFFMGLIANVLLNRFSYRKVALGGAVIHFIGALSTVWVQDLLQLILCFGVLQGMGFGLLLPSALSAFSAYFDKRMTFIMSLTQTAMVMCFMFVPAIGAWSMDTFAFRGSLLLLAGLNLFTLPAAIALQPVKWHWRRVFVENDLKNNVITIDKSCNQVKSTEEPLLFDGPIDRNNTVRERRTKRKPSIPLGERIGSVSTLNDFEENDKSTPFCQSLLDSLDLHLLKDSKYLNISIGLALSFTADVAFYPILPSILFNIGFKSSEIALMMSVFFGADLVARIILSVVSAFVRINSRMLVLCAAVFSAIFRVVLILDDTFKWKITVLALLGFTRCFIQTPQALVISEAYPDKFATAYSLYMAVNGVVCLVLGALMSFVKTATNSDVWVCHILTAAFIVNAISWIVELFGCKKKDSDELKT